MATIGNFLYPKEWVTEDEETIADSIRDWADKEVIPNRQEFDEDYENELIGPAMEKLFVEIGLQKMVWPEKYGGGGFNTPEVATTIVRVLEEIGRADPGIGYIFASTFCALVPIVMEPHVNEDLCAEFAPIFCEAKGSKVCSLILPELGNLDGRSEDDFYKRTVHASVELKDKELVIKGNNLRAINSGGTADLFGIVCRVERSSSDRDISYIFTPADTKRVKRGENFLKTGLNADKNANVSFDNVRVPKKYLVWQGDDANKYLKELFSWHALCSSALCVGSAMDVYETVKRWGTDRVIRYNEILKENPMVAAVLADVAKDILSSRIQTHNLARIIAKSETHGDELLAISNAIGMSVTESTLHAINRAIELMASEGYAREGDVEKHWRDVRMIRNMMGGKVLMQMDVARWFYECKTL